MAGIDEEDLGDGERERLGLGKNEIQKLGFGWSDPSSEYPKPEYLWRSSLNKAATGEKTYGLSMGGADPAIIYQDQLEQINNKVTAEDLDAFSGSGNTTNGQDAYGGHWGDETPIYTRAQIQETKSGHVIMMDDTFGNEKILIKHNRGNGVELSKDGSVLIRSRNNLSVSVDANGILIFEGDLAISCKNLRLDATGDLDITVGGDMSLSVGGDVKENIGGSHRTNVTGNRGEIVEGNKSSTTLGSKTDTTLGDFSDVIKGTFRQTINGERSINVSGQSKHSSESEFVASSPNMNLAAADMSIFGATGTIGGENIIMYNYNMYAGHTVYAGYTMDAPVGNFRRLNGTSAHYTTFHGSLNGKARYATTADTAAAPGGGGGSYSSTSADDLANDTTASVKPDQSILNEYLNQSNRGIAKVSVDEGNYIRDKIVRYAKTGGIARKKLTTAQARAKLKDPNNAANQDFITALIADGSISENYLNPVAPSTGRTYTPGKTAVAPSNHIRAGLTTVSQKIIGGQRANVVSYVPDPAFNPQSIDPRKGPFAITAKTLVGQGIPISTFLSGKGHSTNLGHIATFEERQQLARNLSLQSEVIQISRRDNSKFADYRLIVVEGVYKPEPTESLSSGSPKDLARTGRAITYELYNRRGKTDPSVTYEFAEYLAENLPAYDEIRLDFDNLDPRGNIYGSNNISAQITVIMPEVPADFKISPKYKAKTAFNGKIQSETDLVEIGPQ
jgi:hypothetical protein